MIDERLERMKRKHHCRVHFDMDSFQISDFVVGIYPAKVDGIIYMVKKSIPHNIGVFVLYYVVFYLYNIYDVLSNGLLLLIRCIIIL